jgi:hypothetical protein
MRSTSSNVSILGSISNAMLHTFLTSITRIIFSHPETSVKPKSQQDKDRMEGYRGKECTSMTITGEKLLTCYFTKLSIAANYVALVTARSIGGTILIKEDRRTRIKPVLTPIFHYKSHIDWSEIELRLCDDRLTV